MAEKNGKKAASPAPTPVKAKSEVITINLQPFLTPGSIFLSAILIAVSLLVGLNNVGNILKNGGTVNGAATTNNQATTNTGTTPTTTGTTTVTADQIKSLFDGSHISFGDANRKVLFVEVSDPSCPYCHIAGGLDGSLNKQAGSQFTLVADGGTYVAPVEEMRKLVTAGTASFVWIYTAGHGNGELATEALYCANEQGKFWDAHDLLMNDAGYNLLNNDIKTDTTQTQKMADYLKPAVDSSFMKSCLDSGKYKSKLTSDASLASALGVQGTPGFFVNTKSYPGAYSYTDMKSTVDTALQ